VWSGGVDGDERRLSAQAEGRVSYQPGATPWFIAPEFDLQAEGLPHTGVSPHTMGWNIDYTL